MAHLGPSGQGPCALGGPSMWATRHYRWQVSSTPDSKVSGTFAELGLAPAVMTAVDGVGYEAPSPIQAATIPTLLDGRDVVGLAQTGTGKTAAFALPILSRLDLAQREP